MRFLALLWGIVVCATPEMVSAHGGGCRKSSPPGQCCHMERATGTVHCHWRHRGYGTTPSGSRCTVRMDVGAFAGRSTKSAGVSICYWKRMAEGMGLISNLLQS